MTKLSYSEFMTLQAVYITQPAFRCSVDLTKTRKSLVDKGMVESFKMDEHNVVLQITDAGRELLKSNDAA